MVSPVPLGTTAVCAEAFGAAKANRARIQIAAPRVRTACRGIESKIVGNMFGEYLYRENWYSWLT